MQELHLDVGGRTARVSLLALPLAAPRRPIETRTAAGPVVSCRIRNGLAGGAKSGSITAAAVAEGDPELEIQHVGRVLDYDAVSTAWIDPHDERPRPVTDFKMVDLVFDAQGSEKERRDHVSRRPNLNELHPVKAGRRIKLDQALTQFVFRRTLQIVHVDGVTFDFLFSIARDLDTAQELALLGAGAKGNQPLVLRERGSAYRGFLFGEIGRGADSDRYRLLLLLSDQELKRPAAAQAEEEAAA